ncbi:MAG: protein kinase [Myxococcota bacterium]|nr:protein kinase [Myxococcota bacterium]
MNGHLEERVRGRLGTVLRGKYRLDSVLGVGGMAVVYKATHRNQAEYAIKMLHPELSLSDDLCARFLREGYAANSVKHPGVVRVVDDDVSEDGAAFLVMELLDGIAGDGLCEKLGGRLPIDAACAIAVDLLDVLAAAHAKGIVHRDIKPANLFVMRDGTVKVLDFGIARVRDTMTGGASATGTGIVLGTPIFMAPEQALGRANEVDARADIWSVGATIFSLASGMTVHDAETAPQLLVKLATQPARSLAEVVPGAPPAVVAIVDCALAFDREKRWPTAGAMRDALASARLSVFGGVGPRVVLASIVASGTSGGIGAVPTLLARSDAEAVDVVETSNPVSSNVRKSGAASGQRRSGGVVVAVVGLVALGCVAGSALVLRAKHANRLPTVTTAAAPGPAQAHRATTTGIETVDPPRADAPDADVQVVPTPTEAPPALVAGTSTTRSLASPPTAPKIAPARPASAPNPVQAAAVDSPETRPLPAPPQPPSSATVTAKPTLDPLDGRR